ncbi:MAG: CPBP family intramembrane metalloprotease [Neomegalonema sp.]|nr:CPBP family intramembrane metalloprotease [Neomegalonema sp.]
MSDATMFERQTPRLREQIRRWSELILLFVGAPLAMALVMEPSQFRPTLLGLGLVGVGLLLITRRFKWRTLFTGSVLRHWRMILAFTVGSAAVIAAIVWIMTPHSFFSFMLNNTRFWLFVMIAYPIVLVTPQELIFRPLFFERYGHLFPNKWVAIGVNSVLFGLAHLFYWNWPAVALTFLGNFFFAYAYVEKRSFPLAWLLHAIGGQLIFTIGLGLYFFHGAIPR